MLTVFTPAFNRAHTIGRTYESLCRQTCKEFKWLVIDDGSKDNTKELVDEWKERDNGFDIRYVWKENGGLHTGYNKAIELMDTELCVCIDSDDYMPDDAVEKILTCWKEKGSNKVAGIIGLDFMMNGMPLGDAFPKIEQCHIYELENLYHHKEDVKMVARVDLLRNVYPQPVYYNEKNFNPSYMYYEIDFKYEWLVLNENLCIVDYQPDGMANGIFRQYLNSPNSFACIRIQKFKIPKAPLGFYVKQYIHLASSAILAHNYSWLCKAPQPWLAYLFLPLGWLLSQYIKYKAKL